jgi:energy-coupling factor transport system permease protein
MSDEFEFVRYVTIGQFMPTGSVVHGLDPRAKLLAAGLFVVAIAIAQTVPTTTILLVALLAIAVLARIPLTYLLRGLVPMLPILIVLGALQLIFQGQADRTGTVLWQWWFLRLTTFTVQWVVVTLFRVADFIFLASLLTLTTSTTQLTHGAESLLRPFRRLGLPAHELALVMTVALRFVPILAEEVDRLAKAQASRGGNIGENNRWRPDRVVRARLPLIVPLFLSALRRGEELIIAMEARCYVSGARRSNLIEMHGNIGDVLVVALAVGLVALVWRLNVGV